MKKVKRFGISLDEQSSVMLDKLVKNHKLPNRSRAIRYLVREYASKEACASDAEVSGAVVLIYDHHKRDLLTRSLDIQHDFTGIILASQHVHLNHHNCLEIIALKGRASALQSFADRLIGLKGIKQGKLVMAGL